MNYFFIKGRSNIIKQIPFYSLVNNFIVDCFVYCQRPLFIYLNCLTTSYLRLEEFIKNIILFLNKLELSIISCINSLLGTGHTLAEGLAKEGVTCARSDLEASPAVLGV